MNQYACFKIKRDLLFVIFSFLLGPLGTSKSCLLLIKIPSTWFLKYLFFSLMLGFNSYVRILGVCVFCLSFKSSLRISNRLNINKYMKYIRWNKPAKSLLYFQTEKNNNAYEGKWIWKYTFMVVWQKNKWWKWGHLERFFRLWSHIKLPVSGELPEISANLCSC